MDEEIDYDGQVEVLHLLQVLRDDLGWEAVAEKIKTPLANLKVAPYYGCTLLRPQEAAIDVVERPTVLQELLQVLGATVIDFPFSTECCGSFQIVNRPDFITERSQAILGLAQRQGAETIVLSCPLCSFNLGKGQNELRQRDSSFQSMPIIYFTQLLALSLGVAPEICGFDLNFGEPLSLLQSKGLIT
jgi:heterodisulfide reductase subunit B